MHGKIRKVTAISFSYKSLEIGSVNTLQIQAYYPNTAISTKRTEQLNPTTVGSHPDQPPPPYPVSISISSPTFPTQALFSLCPSTSSRRIFPAQPNPIPARGGPECSAR